MADVELDLSQPQALMVTRASASPRKLDFRPAFLGALIWIVSAELSRAYSVGGLEMNLVWPPDGIAVGLVLAYGLGMIPAIGGGVMV